MAMMKDIFTWFTEKYDKNEDYTNMLFLYDLPTRSDAVDFNDRGIRIIIKHGEGEERMSYIQDLYKGRDYKPNASPDDIFKVLTETIDAIMEVMPNE